MWSANVSSVPCPEIVRKYHEMSSGIDGHEMMRQGDLALEKHWMTQDPYFSIFTHPDGLRYRPVQFGEVLYRDQLEGPTQELVVKEFLSVLAQHLITQ